MKEKNKRKAHLCHVVRANFSPVPRLSLSAGRNRVIQFSVDEPVSAVFKKNFVFKGRDLPPSVLAHLPQSKDTSETNCLEKKNSLKLNLHL